MTFNWLNAYGADQLVVLLVPNIIGALAGDNGDAQPPVDVPVALTVAENIARCACIILVVLPSAWADVSCARAAHAGPISV